MGIQKIIDSENTAYSQGGSDSKIAQTFRPIDRTPKKTVQIQKRIAAMLSTRNRRKRAKIQQPKSDARIPAITLKCGIEC